MLSDPIIAEVCVVMTMFCNVYDVRRSLVFVTYDLESLIDWYICKKGSTSKLAIRSDDSIGVSVLL